MNRTLLALNHAGLRGEWISNDQGSIAIYLDGVRHGSFIPNARGYDFAANGTLLDITSLNRIRTALEKANKTRFRSMAKLHFCG